MRVKLEWLSELVDLSNLSLKEIIDTISLNCIEIESVEALCEATNLVTGKVIEKESHPDSDHLSVCMVDVGSETLQIVCGAPNVAKDQTVIVALVGAVLPGDFKIKKSKIRGIESSGMICSLQELGFEKKYVQEKYQEGIYYFTEDTPIGVNALSALKIDDVVIELGLTPNRSDLLSMIGVANDVSAAFKRPLKELTYTLKKSDVNETVDVEIKTKDCTTYYAVVAKDVVIKDSPQWLASRLIAFGVRPINNVVDITNYIMALFGQPLHAFDYKKLGNKILVRNALKGEVLKTLDLEDRVLEESDVLITDGKKAVALGGVMGGLDSSISNTTKDIVIEAAVFNPASIRKTSTRLNLRSEASIRFEKGVDVNRTLKALDYTCYLLETLADAKISKEYKVAGITEIVDLPISITLDYINKYLGLDLTIKEVVNIFKALDFKTTLESSNELTVYVPNRRSDVTIKADLVEEIGRLYGYDKLPNTLPISNLTSTLSSKQKNIRKIKDVLVGLGLNEVINYSLISKEMNQMFTLNNKNNTSELSLIMPLSEEHKYLRLNLLAGLIENVKYNFARDQKDLALFELGKTYYEKDDKTFEDTYLAITISNSFFSNAWQKTNVQADFYLLKGILEHLLSKFDLSFNLIPLEKSSNELHPKRSASIVVNEKKIGYMGALHPEFSLKNDLNNVYVLEINLEDFIEVKKAIAVYKPVTKIPSMERDIAVVVCKDISAGDLIKSIKQEAKDLISSIDIFDVYEINETEKSIAIKMLFTSFETLTDDIINKKISRILKKLNEEYSATLRS
ncbi:MAG: phenylalanine--tRNA ligase subunit beta [Bacilli bacterium]|nr:phenylalanine--tRNA ligase subunit beta [Bacilli bacterium]